MMGPCKEQHLTEREKMDMVSKLHRVEGRIRGIVRMLDDDRAIDDIMMQVSASYESLRVVMKGLIKKHIEASILMGLVSTNSDHRSYTYHNLINDIFKYVR